MYIYIYTCEWQAKSFAHVHAIPKLGASPIVSNNIIISELFRVTSLVNLPTDQDECILINESTTHRTPRHSCMDCPAQRRPAIKSCEHQTLELH